ncbi:MAG: mechanosensitive ion channel family protein [Hydrogenothermaceae bacterium]
MVEYLNYYHLKTFLIFILSFFILYILRLLTFKFISFITRKTKNELEDIILKQIRLPSIFWIFILSLHITLEFSHTLENHKSFIVKTINFMLILSITIFIANITKATLKKFIEDKNLPTAGSSLTFIIVEVLIYITGFLVLLSHLGVSITPLITTLGIGGLAVGLALKDTLSNIFSGVYILMEKRIDVGDFIELDDNKKGYVMDINWRTTTIKTLSNDLIIVPNEKLAQSIIVNRAKPVETYRVAIQINVSYETDIDKFEKVVMEEVNKFIEEDGEKVAKDQPVVLRFIPGFGSSSLNFTLYLFAKDYDASFYVESELRKRILKRLRGEKIEMPYNKMDIYIKEMAK